MYYKIKDVSVYNDGTMIRCKTENGWLSGKTIKSEDKVMEDEYELALKYFKKELLEED